MLDWLKKINKEYPEFWKSYLSKFNEKSNRYVVMATERSGSHLNSDVLFSIAGFGVVDNSIYIGDNFEVLISQYKYFHENKITNEFNLETKLDKKGEPEALISFLEYIGNAVLVGHNIDIEIEMINTALEKMGCGRLKNEAMDIDIMYKKLNGYVDKRNSLNELSTAFALEIKEINTAPEDAYRIGLLFLKLKSRLKIK